MIVYELQQVTKFYPGQNVPVNKDITLQIHEGEIFGLLGDNGAGKTTLIKQMVNLLKISSGSIQLFGRPIDEDPMYVSLQVGYMPQESYAFNHLTVGEALYFTAHLRGMSRREAKDERDRLLSIWKIEELRDKYSSKLSGGQRRLLRLAVTMAGSPSVLILDEPTNELDPQKRKLVWDILRKINSEKGTTIIFITHDAIEAEKLIKRVGIMHKGQLVAVGEPGELKRAVDKMIRFEMFFQPEQPPMLPMDMNYKEVHPGRYLAFVETDRVSELLKNIELKQLDDFKIYSATLEDLYLYYAAENNE